ncbi:MAG: hypothetical protein R3324_16885, partial [Halobacteriales archaeon]|nr:hypothetical protein [Halobacteriales archaeon]
TNCSFVPDEQAAGMPECLRPLFSIEEAMKPIHWTHTERDISLGDEIPDVHPDFQETQSRPAVTEQLVLSERKRSKEERAVLREIGRKYSPIGIEPSVRRPGSVRSDD